MKPAYTGFLRAFKQKTVRCSFWYAVLGWVTCGPCGAFEQRHQFLVSGHSQKFLGGHPSVEPRPWGACSASAVLSVPRLFSMCPPNWILQVGGQFFPADARSVHLGVGFRHPMKAGQLVTFSGFVDWEAGVRPRRCSGGLEWVHHVWKFGIQFYKEAFRAPTVPYEVQAVAARGGSVHGRLFFPRRPWVRLGGTLQYWFGQQVQGLGARLETFYQNPVDCCLELQYSILGCLSIFGQGAYVIGRCSSPGWRERLQWGGGVRFQLRLGFPLKRQLELMKPKTAYHLQSEGLRGSGVERAAYIARVRVGPPAQEHQLLSDDTTRFGAPWERVQKAYEQASQGSSSSSAGEEARPLEHGSPFQQSSPAQQAQNLGYTGLENLLWVQAAATEGSAPSTPSGTFSALKPASIALPFGIPGGVPDAAAFSDWSMGEWFGLPLQGSPPGCPKAYRSQRLTGEGKFLVSQWDLAAEAPELYTMQGSDPSVFTMASYTTLSSVSYSELNEASVKLKRFFDGQGEPRVPRARTPAAPNPAFDATVQERVGPARKAAVGGEGHPSSLVGRLVDWLAVPRVPGLPAATLGRQRWMPALPSEQRNLPVEGAPQALLFGTAAAEGTESYLVSFDLKPLLTESPYTPLSSVSSSGIGAAQLEARKAQVELEGFFAGRQQGKLTVPCAVNPISSPAGSTALRERVAPEVIGAGCAVRRPSWIAFPPPIVERLFPVDRVGQQSRAEILSKPQSLLQEITLLDCKDPLRFGKADAVGLYQKKAAWQQLAAQRFTLLNDQVAKGSIEWIENQTNACKAYKEAFQFQQLQWLAEAGHGKEALFGTMIGQGAGQAVSIAVCRLQSLLALVECHRLEALQSSLVREGETVLLRLKDYCMAQTEYYQYQKLALLHEKAFRSYAASYILKGEIDGQSLGWDATKVFCDLQVKQTGLACQLLGIACALEKRGVQQDLRSNRVEYCIAGKEHLHWQQMALIQSKAFFGQPLTQLNLDSLRLRVLGQEGAVKFWRLQVEKTAAEVERLDLVKDSFLSESPSFLSNRSSQRTKQSEQLFYEQLVLVHARACGVDKLDALDYTRLNFQQLGYASSLKLCQWEVQRLTLLSGVRDITQLSCSDFFNNKFLKAHCLDKLWMFELLKAPRSCFDAGVELQALYWEGVSEWAWLRTSLCHRYTEGTQRFDAAWHANPCPLLKAAEEFLSGYEEKFTAIPRASVVPDFIPFDVDNLLSEVCDTIEACRQYRERIGRILEEAIHGINLTA